MARSLKNNYTVSKRILKSMVSGITLKAEQKTVEDRELFKLVQTVQNVDWDSIGDAEFNKLNSFRGSQIDANGYLDSYVDVKVVGFNVFKGSHIAELFPMKPEVKTFSRVAYLLDSGMAERDDIGIIVILSTFVGTDNHGKRVAIPEVHLFAWRGKFKNTSCSVIHVSQLMDSVSFKYARRFRNVLVVKDIDKYGNISESETHIDTLSSKSIMNYVIKPVDEVTKSYTRLKLSNKFNIHSGIKRIHVSTIQYNNVIN